MTVADYFGLHRCRPAAFTQQVCSGVGDTGTVLGTRTGFRAVATANMAGYCTGTRVRA